MPSPAPLTSARIPPLDPTELSDAQRGLAAGGTAPNFLLTLSRHDALFKGWLGFSTPLVLQGKLSPRLRELVIMHVALRERAPYIWGQHIPLSLSAKVTLEELQAIVDGSPWPEAEQAVFDAVDELLDQNFVTDATWARVAATNSDLQLMELLILTGLYRMVAGFMNSVGLQSEPGIPGLGELGQ